MCKRNKPFCAGESVQVHVSPASDPVSLHKRVHTFLFCSPAEPVPSAPTGIYRRPSSLGLPLLSELHTKYINMSCLKKVKSLYNPNKCDYQTHKERKNTCLKQWPELYLSFNQIQACIYSRCSTS